MGAAGLAQAQAFSADYALTLGGKIPGAGLSVQAGSNWFGQLALAQGQVSAFMPGAGNGSFNLAGGFRWTNGQVLSLQLSRARGPGQRLGLSLNYDWPRYFVRLSFDHQGLYLVPQDSLRFAAGVRF